MLNTERSIKAGSFLAKLLPAVASGDKLAIGGVLTETILDALATRRRESESKSLEQVAGRLAELPQGIETSELEVFEPFFFKAIEVHASEPFEETKVAIESVLARVWSGRMSLEEGDSTLVLLERLSNLEIRLLAAVGMPHSEWEQVRQDNIHQNPQSGLSCAVMMLGGDISDETKRDPVRMAAESLERYFLAEKGYAKDLDRGGAMVDCIHRVWNLTRRGRLLSEIIREYSKSIESS